MPTATPTQSSPGFRVITYGAGKDYTNETALATYLNERDMSQADEIILVDAYQNMNLNGQTIKLNNTTATRRVIIRPVPGLGINQYDPEGPLAIGTEGLELTIDTSNRLQVSSAVTFEGWRVRLTGTGTNNGGSIRLAWGGYNAPLFSRCRISVECENNYAIVIGENYSDGAIHDCLVVFAANSPAVLLACYGGPVIDVQRNTVTRLGGSVGSFIEGMLNGTFRDNVMSNMGGTATKGSYNPGVASNNFSDNAADTGKSGFTVVAANTLLTNSTTDFRPKANGPLIGAASTASQNTFDLRNKFRGMEPDVGTTMLAVAVPIVTPVVTITEIIKYGQKVVVKGTFTDTPTSTSATLTAASTPNGAVTKTGTVALNFGDNTFTATFEACNPGSYNTPAIVLTNSAGSGTATGGAPVTIAVPGVPVVTITSQSKTTNSITVAGTVTNYPTSGTLTVTGPTAGSTALAIADDGAFTATLTGRATGTYTISVAATNYSGTGTTAGAAISIYAQGQQPPGEPAVALPAYVAPAFNSPSVANDETITTLTLENTTGASATNQPFTVGHPFKRGQLKMSDSLVGKIVGQPDIALQFDPKSTWPDGSVRHGLISGILPSIGANALIPVAVARSTAARDNTPVAPSTIVASSIDLIATAVIGGVTYTANADAALTANVGIKTWLSGPVVTEYTFEVPFKTSGGTPHAMLKAQFAVRYYSSLGKAKVDVTVENVDYKFSGSQDPTNISDVTYDASVSVGGTTVYTKAGLTHHATARWKKTFWHNGETALHVKFNTAYLLDSKVFPNYDRTLVIAESLLASRVKSDYGAEPMQAGNNNGYMPTSGAHHEIGLHPEWHVEWLLSQDKRSKKFALLNADVAGSWAIHLRDRSTGPNAGYPVNTIHFPKITSEGSHGDSFNPETDKYESPSVTTSSPHTPDSPHQPNFSALPFILTGDYFYLEEMIFWSSWNSWKNNPAYRGYHLGLTVSDQVRGQGWCIRTHAYTAALLPDSHDLKRTYHYILENNLDWYVSQYINGPATNVFGCIVTGTIFSGYGPGWLAPWQDDFVTQSFGIAADLGYAKAKTMLDFKARFPVDRMIAPGVCWSVGAPYVFKVKNNNESPLFTSIAEAYQATYTESNPGILTVACGSVEMSQISGNTLAGDMGGNSASAEGFPSNMQPALAYAVDSGYPDADLAWMQFMSRTVQPNYAEDGAQFAVVPREFVAAEPSTLTATVSLVTAAGVAVGALTGLRWAWFDQPTPDLFAAPTDKGSVEVTNSSGVLTLDLINSTKTSGQIGWLIVTNSDGTTGTVHKAFSGPVAVN